LKKDINIDYKITNPDGEFITITPVIPVNSVTDYMSPTQSAKEIFYKELQNQIDNKNFLLKEIQKVLIEKYEPKQSLLEKILFIIKYSEPLINLFYSISKLMEAVKMSQNTLDSIKGVIRAIMAVLVALGVSLPGSLEPVLISIIIAVYGAWELISGLLSNSKQITK
jgi:hypothetical protein